MGKFRSKLKKKPGNKRWARGHASTSNPETNKHRAKAKSRFFQANLSLAPPAVDDSGSASRLTLEAVLKHDAIQSYGKSGGGGDRGKEGGPTVNDIAASMKSFSMNDADGDDGMTGSGGLGTFKTFQTFASNWSACSNMSFKKLLNNFRADSQLQKDMLAILAALTEVIKENGGSQSSTEYFLGLMETIEATKEESDTVAAVSLLSMGIKSVPEAVLRKKFSETAQTLLGLLERYAESDNQNMVRSIVGCLSVVLRAQEYSQWKLSSTLKFFDGILSFVIHTKPKIRKAAQHAVVAIIHGSCFMLPPKMGDEEKMDDGEQQAKPGVKCHPVGGRVARFCVGQFKPENIGNNQTLVLHTLGLLHNALPGFSKDDIKLVAESLLSIMTATNVLIRTNCFQTFHSLFSSKTENLTPNLAGKLLAALYDYRPDRSDSKQIIAWLTVLKEGHLFLAKSNLTMCSSALPRFVDVCTRDFWSSDRMEVVSSASNSLKDILYECVQACCEDDEVEKHRVPIERILTAITDVLSSAPFGHASNQVLIILAIAFDIAGKHFGPTLAPALKTLGNRYDPQSSSRIQIEHAVLQAIGSMDTGLVLQCIPLAEESGKIDLEKTWMLPLLREGLNQSRLEIFNSVILKLAYQCYVLWNKFKETDNKQQAHVFELLCCQLWGLFPGFCRRPQDIQHFKLIAKTLGTVLNENPDLRSPILDGLKELIPHLESDADKAEVGKYAKNFLPRLFNIYTTKPKGSYENEVRQAAFDVIKTYLAITPGPILDELHKVALDQLTTKAPGTFIYDMLFDVVEQLSLYQSAEKLDDIYQRYITVILKRDKSQETVAKTNANVRRQMKKAFKLLREILASDHPGCVEFRNTRRGNVEKLLLGTLHSTFDGIQAPRLACLKLLIEKNPEIKTNSKLVTRTIPEAIVSYNVEAVKQENLSNDLIEMIGTMFNNETKINEFVDLIIAGFTGDSILIANTIWVLKNVLQTFTGTLTVDTLRFMLEQVGTFVIGNNRTEVEAALNFVLLYVKILPVPLVTNYLPLITKAISMMNADTKRHCRQLVGYTLKRLCKRFGAEEIIKLVPGNDEVTHKRLKKIRKEMARARRNKLEDQKRKKKGGAGAGGADSDSDDEESELAGHLEKKSLTIDDILADSDSDSDSGVEDERKAKKKMATYIKESPENIVDLADLDAISKITTSQPMDQSEPGSSGLNRGPAHKKKDPNRGFATASDGRLIIEDIEDYSDSDEDPDEAVGYKDKAKKRVYDEESSDSNAEEEVEPADGADGPSSRKRKAMEAMSMRSGMSGGSRGYVAGGKGIHRPVAASVKSGYSGKSSKSTKTFVSASGTEYRSKKAQGDMLKKGKHEPYAYVPLSRNSLNRRKRAKSAGQFKGIVKGARKGAAAGAKSRMVKKTGAGGGGKRK